MNEWEAKYKALSAKLDPKHIEAAEKLPTLGSRLQERSLTAANEIQRNS